MSQDDTLLSSTGTGQRTPLLSFHVRGFLGHSLRSLKDSERLTIWKIPYHLDSFS